MPLTAEDKWVVDTLMEIKGDIGELKSIKADVAEVKANVDDLTTSLSDIREHWNVLNAQCPAHVSEMRQLGTRVDHLDTKVDSILMTELPRIQQQLAVHEWFKTTRHKIIAAVAVAALGVGGSIMGTVLTEKLKSVAAGSSALASPNSASHATKP